MIARTLSILFFAAALITGLTLGWGYSLDTALRRVSASGLEAFKSAVQNNLHYEVWDAAFLPFLNMPAWSGWALGGLVFFVVGALRPGR